MAAATVRAAVAQAAREMEGLPLVAGGKSFGGRMTSTAAAEAPLPGVRGLAFVGFPLHPPGQPGTSRAEHLARVMVPMLFLQGTRDEFAELPLLTPVVAGLGARATLHVVEGANHSFAVPKKSGRGLSDVLDDLARAAQRLGSSPVNSAASLGPAPASSCLKKTNASFQLCDVTCFAHRSRSAFSYPARRSRR